MPAQSAQSQTPAAPTTDVPAAEKKGHFLSSMGSSAFTRGALGGLAVLFAVSAADVPSADARPLTQAEHQHILDSAGNLLHNDRATVAMLNELIRTNNPLDASAWGLYVATTATIYSDALAAAIGGNEALRACVSRQLDPVRDANGDLLQDGPGQEALEDFLLEYETYVGGNGLAKVVVSQAAKEKVIMRCVNTKGVNDELLSDIRSGSLPSMDFAVCAFNNWQKMVDHGTVFLTSQDGEDSLQEVCS